MPPAVGAAASDAVSATGASSARAETEVVGAVIVLDTPARADELITTRDVVVRGHVREGSGQVVVMLEARGPGRMVIVTVIPTLLAARHDRSQRSPFIATLPLSDPRPTGAAVVHVIAYDARGNAAEILLRTIQIGPELDPTYGDGAGRPPTGEDGLMGGIPFGTNFSWVEDGR